MPDAVGSKNYFSGLNYTLANEDTELEYSLLPEGCATVLTVAGSGARALPLVARAPRRLLCVDLSARQLALTELRLALAREAELAEYMAFFGYPQAGGPVREGEAALLRRKWIDKLELSPLAREFLKQWLAGIDWGTPLYEGGWERTFARLSSVVRPVIGKRAQQVFECRSLTEQRSYLENGFPTRRWRLAISMLGNAAVFNALLYRGSFPKKNIRGSMRGFYQARFDRLFGIAPARENFFLQLCVYGRLLHPEGNPIECRPDVFIAAKQALVRTQVDYVQGDVLDAAAGGGGQIDFVSLSDVPSYFSGDVEKNFMQTIRPGLNTGARVVVRNYLRVPEDCDVSGYRLISKDFEKEILREKVGVYDIDVWELS